MENTIEVLQRDPEGYANTCFNYLTKEKKIEVYQIYQIDKGSLKKTLYYIPTVTIVDIESGHARIHCGALQKEKPGDIYNIIQKIQLEIAIKNKKQYNTI